VASRAASRLGPGLQEEGARGRAGSEGERREESQEVHEGWTNGFMTRPDWDWVEQGARRKAAAGWTRAPRSGRNSRNAESSPRRQDGNPGLEPLYLGFQSSGLEFPGFESGLQYPGQDITPEPSLREQGPDGKG